MTWMEHGLQISLTRYALSMEDKMAAAVFRRAMNYGYSAVLVLFPLPCFVFFCDYELWVKRPFDALFLCYSRCTVSTDEFCILL